MVSASNIPKYLSVSFSWSVLIFLDLVVLFLPSFVFFRLSLLAWCIFLCQIPSLCSDCIFYLPVLEFQIFFFVWCRPCTLHDWIFSCDLLSLYFQCISWECNWVATSLLQIVMVIAHLPGIYLSGFLPKLSFFLLQSNRLSSFPSFFRIYFHRIFCTFWDSL